MGRTISIDEIDRMVIEFGYFNGLNRLIKEYDVPRDKIAKIKARMFEHIGFKVSEAKKEAAKLPQTIARMEMACRSGMTPKIHLAHEAFDTDYRALSSALEPFDGWTVSLLETDVSLLATVFDPPTAGRRVNFMRSSFADLWNARASEKKAFKNYPELFDMVILKR